MKSFSIIYLFTIFEVIFFVKSTFVYIFADLQDHGEDTEEVTAVGAAAGVEMATEVAEKCPVALEVSVDAEAVEAGMHPINLPFNAHEPTTTTLLDARSTFCMRKNLCCITPRLVTPYRSSTPDHKMCG